MVVRVCRIMEKFKLFCKILVGVVVVLVVVLDVVLRGGSGKLLHCFP